MRPLNRLKKQKRPFTTELFYIYQCNNGHWQLRETHSHKVVCACPSLNALTKSITTVFTRYKHYDHYLSVMTKNTFSLPTPPKELEYREKQYKTQGHKYEYILEEILSNMNHLNTLETQVQRRALPVKPKEVKVVPQVVIEPKRVIKKKRVRL